MLFHDGYHHMVHDDVESPKNATFYVKALS